MFSSSAMEYQKVLLVKQWKAFYQDNKKLTGSEKLMLSKLLMITLTMILFIGSFKLRDPGTSRSIVMQDEKEALMVTYTSGGSTPGDS
jgi:cell division protein FtsL